MSRSNDFGLGILVFFKSIYHFLSFVMFFFISWNVSYDNDFIVIYVSLSLYLLSTLINFAFFLIDLKLKPKRLEIIYSFLTIFVPVIVVFIVMFIVGYKNLFCEKDNFVFINTFSILAKKGTEKTLVLWNEIFDVQNNRERYALENPTVEKHKFIIERNIFSSSKSNRINPLMFLMRLISFFVVIPYKVIISVFTFYYSHILTYKYNFVWKYASNESINERVIVNKAIERRVGKTFTKDIFTIDAFIRNWKVWSVLFY